MAREVVPDVTRGGRVDVGLAQLQRKFIGHRTLVVVGALLAAVDDLPGLLVVVAGNRGIRPVVAVAGNFTTVVEIIQHAELQRQFVLVGRDVDSIHGQRRVAIADFHVFNFQVAEYLIVGAVLLENVDHMSNRVGV